jgi:hypothetical protein
MLNLISSSVVRDPGNCSVWAPRDYKSEVRPLRGDLGPTAQEFEFFTRLGSGNSIYVRKELVQCADW